MRSNFSTSRAVALCATVLAAGLSPSCAEERAPIDRTQPNVLPKAFFVGDLADPGDDPEFYLRTTLVDVPAGASSDGLFTSSDAQPTTRVRFEITEKLLLARLTYERIEDTDYKGARRTPDGQVVVAYPIEKHFDVRREYNSTTGEETNVLVENDWDLPWQERPFFRVDWSKNLITDAYELDALSQLSMWYGVKWEPVAFYASTPGDPNAPVFDVSGGYFDVTLKAFAAPQMVHDDYWGDFPACWLYGSWPMVDCNPHEITLRQAFKRVTDTDYEPLVIDGGEMDMFGAFYWDRFGYDRRYGVVDDRWRRLATRWNIWDRSHADPAVLCATPETTPPGASPNRDEDANGTEDECEAVGRGSRCDAAVGECTIPYRDRTVRTIAWHVSLGFDETLWGTSVEALGAWNEAIRIGVAAGRLAECRRTGGSGCDAQMAWPVPWRDTWAPPLAGTGAVPNVFVLCHNPVQAGEDPACGPEETVARLGDLRFNIMAVVNEYQEMSPWGIYADAEDPLTGEKISGSVNEWGAVLDRAASNLVDVLALLNGEIDPTEFIEGENVSTWVRANKPGGASYQPPGMSAEEIASRKAAFDPKVLAPYLDGLDERPESRKAPPQVRHRRRAQVLQDQGRLGPGNGVLSARLKALKGTEIEAALITPEMAQAAGLDPTAPLSNAGIDRASPFGRMNPVYRRGLERQRRLADARRHACRREAPEADHVLGLAREAQRLFPSPDPNDAGAVHEHRLAVWNWARQQLHRGVIAHEFGHSMALRHNFAASFDSLNYRAGYWQLRTSNATVVDDCADGTVDGTSCIGPRWRDPISPAEIENNIGKYAITSVMDYPGDENNDMGVAGPFDRAALRFFYGGTVDVWADDGVSVNAEGPGQQLAYELTAFTTSPGLFGVYYLPPVDPAQPYEFVHYSQYRNRFNLIRSCQPSNDPAAVLGQVCETPAMDVVDYRDMSDWASDPAYASFSWANAPKAVDAQGRVRRGYLFNSDEFADTGNVPAFTNDAGADAYEIIRFLEAGYENRYIFDSFRRNRVRFTSWDQTWRVQARYLDNIQQIAKTFAFGAILDGDPAQPSAELLEDGYYGPLAMGATVALDLFARQMVKPEPGYYCDAQYCGAGTPAGFPGTLYAADWAPLPDEWLYDFHLGLGDGRYVHNDFDYAQGYFWSDYQTQVGSYYDKVWANWYLAEAFDSFISNSKEDFTDGRYKNVNFATVFPDQVRRLYSNLLTGDVAAYAPWVMVPDEPETTPEAILKYPRFYASTGFGIRPARAKMADPDWAWNEQIYAMVWGAMFFSTNWSNSWVNEARIVVTAGDQIGWPADETFVFTHPVSGMTYRAHSTGTEDVFGETRQKGVGARMLQWANRLLADAYVTRRDAAQAPLFNPDGTPQLILDANGKAQPEADAAGAAQALQKYVDNLDIFRQVTAEFERPLDPWWDLPAP